eukprot:3463969-Rhodomonas_salina.1
MIRCQSGLFIRGCDEPLRLPRNSQQYLMRREPALLSEIGGSTRGRPGTAFSDFLPWWLHFAVWQPLVTVSHEYRNSRWY